MRISIALKSSTVILEHRLDSRGYRTYWQEYGVDFSLFGCSPLGARQETKRLHFHIWAILYRL
jgi:hypothetical protein